jgi:hypothetical protein
MLGGSGNNHNTRDGRSSKTAIEIDPLPLASWSESNGASSVADTKKESGWRSDSDSFVPLKGKLSLHRRRKSHKRQADPKSEASSDESSTENAASKRADEPGPLGRKKKEPKFWFVEGDCLEFEPTRRFVLTVRGNPLPKQRHRITDSGFFSIPLVRTKMN